MKTAPASLPFKFVILETLADDKLQVILVSKGYNRFTKALV